MKGDPPIFDSASAIEVQKIQPKGVRLTAPGFVYDLFTGYGDALAARVARESSLRPGHDRQLSYVCVGMSYETPVVYFTSHDEAINLVDRILQAKNQVTEEKGTGFRYKWWRSCVEVCGTALAVGLLGSMAAKVGWAAMDPVANWLTHQLAPNEVQFEHAKLGPSMAAFDAVVSEKILQAFQEDPTSHSNSTAVEAPVQHHSGRATAK